MISCIEIIKLHIPDAIRCNYLFFDSSIFLKDFKYCGCIGGSCRVSYVNKNKDARYHS